MPTMTDTSAPFAGRSTTRHGLGFALAAFGLWILGPLFFKLIGHISPLEIVAHRALWSVPVGAAIVLYAGRTADIVRALKTPRLLALLFVSTVLISFNWTVFVWAVANDRTLDASLGYFINPLLNVLIGYVFLSERLTRAQVVAVGLAATGVVIQTVSVGVFPWVAMLLAVSFATYGYLKKTIAIGPVQGFVVETALLSPLALGYMIWLGASGTAAFGGTAFDTAMLLACGPATAIPLILFASAARRLRYATIGLMQYMVPTGFFFIAVYLFGEPVSAGKLTSFVFIWVALAIYSIDASTHFTIRRARAGSLQDKVP